MKVTDTDAATVKDEAENSAYLSRVRSALAGELPDSDERVHDYADGRDCTSFFVPLCKNGCSLRNESDASSVVEDARGIQVSRAVASRLDRSAILHLKIGNLVGRFAGIALSFVQAVPRPEMEWVCFGNIEDATGHHWQGGDQIFMPDGNYCEQ